MAGKVLSVFIDESGDFGAYNHHSPFYIVAMVLHDQSVDISNAVSGLEGHLANLGYATHVIHTGPLIRRESDYSNDLMVDRKRLFNALLGFARKMDFHYMCATVKKKECADIISMTAKLSRAVAAMLSEHKENFATFDRIIIYYDNGQVELTKILTSVFTALFANVEFRKVRPVDYKLFQVADLICTVELMALKSEMNAFSKSEQEFFGGQRSFKKSYLKPLMKKRI